VGHDIKLTASDSFQLGGYRADPATAPKGAVVVIQEIFGVNHHIRAVCDRLAGEGYVAIAPAIFDRVEPNFQSGYTPDEITVARKFVANPDWAAMLRDTQAAIDAVKDAGPVGIIGFCLGGSVAYAAATKLSGLSAAIGYYGGAVVRFADDKPQVPTQLHFGERMRVFRSATSRPSAPSGPMSRFTSIPARSMASIATSGRVTIRRVRISPGRAVLSSLRSI
jgi:carboxymethylenebutenolidase